MCPQAPIGGPARTGPRRTTGAYRCAARRSGSVGTTGYPRVRLRKATLQPDTPLISEPDRTAVPFAPARLAYSRGTIPDGVDGSQRSRTDAHRERGGRDAAPPREHRE